MSFERPTIGLFGINMHGAADRAATRVAELAEKVGYDSLWAGDHVVLPRPRGPLSPMEPDEPILDPLIALAHLAGRTDRILLGTGVVVLTQRHPLILAKQAASLDVLTGGRLLLGLGVGYLEPEMTALGVPMRERAGRTDEFLHAMRRLWEDPAPAYQGRYVDFQDVDAYPRPIQRPLPIILGGHSAAAHRRAADRADRPLHISVAPARRLDADAVRAYAELGVDRLIVVPPPRLSTEELSSFVEDHAPARLGGQPAPA